MTEHVGSWRTKKVFRIWLWLTVLLLIYLVYLECHKHGGSEPSTKRWCQYYQSTRRHTLDKLNSHQCHSSNLKSRALYL